MNMKLINVPEGAYMVVAFMDDGTHVTDYIMKQRNNCCSMEYITDMHDAVKEVRRRFGNCSKRVVIAKINSVLDMLPRETLHDE